ncbi:MAG: hypothetical protein L0Z50_24070, partial [Verrucomicrobiales bacterium]|nr:hypothetical protein [Verrucomicrobiales bacterium]
KLKRVHDSLRKAILEIARVGDVPVPTDNELGVDWESVFKQAKWQLERDPQSAKQYSEEEVKGKLIKADGNKEWTDSELLKAMTQLRQPWLPDLEWRYHLLCVGTFANSQYERGVNYDIAGIDTDQAPTEGAVIAAKWPIPKGDEPGARDWRNVNARFFGEAPDLYFRTAVHEIGHATGLGHRYVDYGFMNTTDTIARQGMAEAQEAKEGAALATFLFRARAIDKEEFNKRTEKVRDHQEFPKNVKWEFSEDDLERLMHAPDVMVRPGAFNAENVTVFSDEKSEPTSDFKLYLTPLLESVPYGAPVRIRLQLENVSGTAQEAVPESLHLKSGLVSGSVVHQFGQPRAFEALMVGDDYDRYRPTPLPPGQSQCHSVTLLRGHEGPLFASEGTYTVQVRVTWRYRGKNVFVEGRATVQVTPPNHVQHKMAARNLLDNPQSLFALVVGGDLDAQTNAILSTCLGDPVLAPHFRVIEAKRLIEKGDISAASAVLKTDIVMSISEIHRLTGLLEGHKNDENLNEANEAIELLSEKEKDRLRLEPFEESP